MAVEVAVAVVSEHEILAWPERPRVERVADWRGEVGFFQGLAVDPDLAGLDLDRLARQTDDPLDRHARDRCRTRRHREKPELSPLRDEPRPFVGADLVARLERRHHRDGRE